MNKLFNSLFEMQLRILLLLSQEEVSAMSMDRIVALDFITIYGAEFKVADFNLNGDSLYKFSEIASRRAAMQQAIKKSVVNGFVKVEVHNGFQSILAISEMEKGAGKSHLKSNQFGSDAEDFISNYKIVILKNLDKYNDSDHLTEDGKKYCFSTFLKHLAPEALSVTYAEIHGVTRDVEKKFTQVMGIMKRIAAEKQIAVSAVTPEMIHEIKTTTSVRDITAILDYVRGKASVEQMMEEDSWEKESMKEAGNLDTDIFDVLDLDTQKLFDGFFARLTDVEKFFVLLEVHCCDMDYTKMTSGELATDDIFVSIVAADSKLRKNISTGDIKIERPGRSSASGMTSIEMKNVEFVSDNVIRYQRRKAVTTLQSLSEGLQVHDITGTCGVNYFRNQWDVLVQKYL